MGTNLHLLKTKTCAENLGFMWIPGSLKFSSRLPGTNHREGELVFRMGAKKKGAQAN